MSGPIKHGAPVDLMGLNTRPQTRLVGVRTPAEFSAEPTSWTQYGLSKPILLLRPALLTHDLISDLGLTHNDLQFTGKPGNFFGPIASFLRHPNFVPENNLSGRATDERTYHKVCPTAHDSGGRRADPPYLRHTISQSPILWLVWLVYMVQTPVSLTPIRLFILEAMVHYDVVLRRTSQESYSLLRGHNAVQR